MFKRHHHVYQAPDGDGSAAAAASGGDSAAAGAAQAAAAGAADTGAAAAGAQGAQGAAAGNLLSDLGQPDGGQGGAASGAPEWSQKVPEQFHVKRADGTLDAEATMLKQAESYGQLHKRMVDNGAPPKDAAEYKVTVPEAYAGKWDPEADESVAAFRKTAIGLGLSQKQFEGVVNAYIERIPGMIEQTQEQRAAECKAALEQVWTTPKDMKANSQAAYRAVETIMGADAGKVFETLGNDPLFLRFAAAVGAEMREDPSPGAGSADGLGEYRNMTRDQLMSHPAYSDAKHVDHDRVNGLVRRMFEKQFGTDTALA